MKITAKDKELFKALSQSQIGRDLADYLNRVSDSICDVRSWGKDDTKESVSRAAQSIKEFVINKITTVKKAGVGSSDYE